LRLRELVPEARIATAHGQMGEHKLEAVVEDFWEKRFDVLVCTTIVETGLDISEERVNRQRRLPAESYRKRARKIPPLHGDKALLADLIDAGIPTAIATSGRMETARPVLENLGVDFDKVPVVTRDQV
jgi:phosphoglycolate phosphatase-like HAD superfamily hydrolase